MTAYLTHSNFFLDNIKNMTKKCGKCKKNKELSYFALDRTHPSGYRNYCKKCSNEAARTWRKNNIDSFKESQKKSRKKHYLKNRENILKKTDEWRKKNIEKVREINRRWYKRNIKYFSKYRKNKRKNSPEMRVKTNIYGVIYRYIRNPLSVDSDIFISSFITWKVKEFRAYFESLFEPWMNWDNWGKRRGCWTIDHIVPQSSFTFIDKNGEINNEEIKKCWMLKNLRPLSFTENIIKSNK
jgi:hypothetical protein